jgi:uncharacterized integral membrane protein
MDRQDPEPGRDWTARLVALAVALALLVIFVAENFNIVEVRLLVVKTETRLAWALIIAGGLGFVAGLLLPRLRR